MALINHFPGDNKIISSSQNLAGVDDAWYNLQSYAASDFTVDPLSPIGSSAFKVICTKGNPYPGNTTTHRTEVYTRRNLGDERWWGGSYYFPTDYVFDPAPEAIFQLHALGGSPAISIQNTDDDMSLIYHYGATASELDRTRVIEPIGALIRGARIDIVLHYKMSNGADGRLELWKDGVKLVDYTGPLGYENVTGGLGEYYPKCGIYKWVWTSDPSSSTATQRILWIDNVKWGDAASSYAEVNPAPSTPPTLYNLTLNASGNGTVTDETGTGPYEPGAIVTVTASPSPGHLFKWWEDETIELIDQNTFQYTVERDTVLTARFQPIVADPEETVDLPLHPITHPFQKYICPSDAENGDNIGKVEHLRSHKHFHNRHFGTNIVDSDYSFAITAGNSDGAFAIDPATGELIVSNITLFTATRTLTVKVQLYSWYFGTTECEIMYIPAADCIYFDPDSEAEVRDGSRSAPWRKIRTSATESQAGKTYLFRRDKAISNDWTVLINPLLSAYINIGAWGQGARPVINGSFNDDGSKNHRFIQIGGDGFSSSGATPELEGNNIRVFDLETTLDDPATNAWYPFEVKPFGKNIEFHRIKCEHIEAFQDGFFWLAGPYESGVDPTRNILLRDIECRQFKYRAIKPESGGVLIENVWFYTSLSNTETPLAFATHPYCEVKYMDSKVVDVDTSKFGLQIRAHNHNYRWVCVDGYANALTVYFLSDTYDINANVGFHDIIIKNSKGKDLYFGRVGGTIKTANGVQLNRVDVPNPLNGFEIAEGATNTTLAYVRIIGATGDGIHVWPDAGAGTKLHNVTVKGSTNLDINYGTTEIGEIVNVNYDTVSTLPGGVLVLTSSTSDNTADLAAAGTDIGYTLDLLNRSVSSPPSIGAIEYEGSTIVYDVVLTTAGNGLVSGEGTYDDGELVSVTATPNSDYQFVRWTEGGIEVSLSNPYTFNISADRFLNAEFEPVPVPVYEITVTTGSGGSATGGGQYEQYEAVSLTATPNTGFQFLGWYENGVRVSEDNPYLFPALNGREISAQFTLIPAFYTIVVSAGPGGTASGGGQFSPGETATVVANPTGNQSFIRWERNGQIVSGEQTYSFVVNEDSELVAIFGPKVKYRCNYRNHFNDLCRVDITFEGYEGGTILLRAVGDNACTVIRDCSDDPYDPIIVTKAQVNLIQQEHKPINVQELQEAEDRKFVLSFYVEGVLKFKGFIVPDGINQNFQSPPYDVQITATDGLMLLSGIPYSHNNLPGGRNPMNYFRQILFSNLGLPLPIRWINTLINDNWPFETDIFTGSLRWAARGEGFTDYAGTVKDGYYILENMMKSMQCRLVQDDGHWTIWRINDVVSGEFTYKSIGDDLGEFDIQEEPVNVNRSVGGIRDGFDYSFIEEDALVMSKKALKTVTVTYAHEQRENILPNGSMDLINTAANAPIYWGILSGTTAVVQAVPSLAADRGYAVEVNNDWATTETCVFGLYPNKLPIDTDVLYNSFNFSFKFSILSGAFVDAEGFIVWDTTFFPLKVEYHAGTTVYYLNEFGYWTTTDAYINITINALKLGDVATVDFRAKQPFIKLPLPEVVPIGRTDEPYLSISFEIPENRRVIFDDIEFSVEQNNDIYEATSSMADNSASENYDLNISTSHNGFHISNFMSGFENAGVEKFFSDGKLSSVTLTEMTAHAIVRNRYRPSIMFEGSIYARNYSYAEIYNVMLLNGKKLLPLKTSWNTETNTVNLTAVEIRDDGTGIYVRHFATNDNRKQLYGEQ